MDKNISRQEAVIPTGTGIPSKLNQARAQAQPKGSSPSWTDIPYRKVSIYFSVLLAKFRVAPNQITVFWVFLGLIADVGLASSQRWVVIVAACLFQVSYLLDFVDGEVSRLENRTSKRGFLLDLSGHGLIKTGLFLAIAYNVAATTARTEYLILGFLACVSVSSLNALYTFASYAGVSNKKQYASVSPDQLRQHRSTLRRAVSLFGIFFESPGVYGLVLIAAVAQAFSWLLMFFGVLGPLWFAFRLAQYRYE